MRNAKMLVRQKETKQRGLCGEEEVPCCSRENIPLPVSSSEPLGMPRKLLLRHMPQWKNFRILGEKYILYYIYYIVYIIFLLIIYIYTYATYIRRKIILQGTKWLNSKSTGQLFTTGKYTLYIRILKWILLWYLNSKISHPSFPPLTEKIQWGLHASDCVFSIFLIIFIRYQSCCGQYLYFI